MNDKTPSMDILEALRIAEAAAPMNPWGRALQSLRYYFRELEEQFREMRDRWQRRDAYANKCESVIRVAEEALVRIATPGSTGVTDIANGALQLMKSADVRTCQANRSADPPQDCDWPHCGCDVVATKVLEALQEEGWVAPRDHAAWRSALAELVACKDLKDEMDTHLGNPQLRENLRNEYEARKAVAWSTARALLREQPMSRQYDDATSRMLWGGGSRSRLLLRLSCTSCGWNGLMDAQVAEDTNWMCPQCSGTWKPHAFEPVAGTNTCRVCGLTYEATDAHHPDARSSR